MEFYFLTQGTNSSSHKRNLPISWAKPNPGWHKLNTDASVLSSLSFASGGGLLRDSCGSWVQSFTKKIGTTNYLLVELWALKDGFSMASLGHSLFEPFVYYMTPPFGIMEVLSNDANAVLYNRASRVVTTEFM